MEEDRLSQLLAGFKEEILTSVKEVVATNRDELLTSVDRKNSGLASSLQKEIKKFSENTAPVAQSLEENTPKSEEKLTLSALKKELELLRQEAKQKDLALAAKTRDAVISQKLSSNGLLFPDKAFKAFMLDFQDKLVEENGSWFVKDNDDVKTLDDSLNTFLESDFGKLFKNTASAGKGLGLRNEKSHVPVAKETLNSMLFAEED